MTATELTHTVQHLLNQGQADVHWFANLRGVMEHHAVKIDAISGGLFSQE